MEEPLDKEQAIVMHQRQILYKNMFFLKENLCSAEVAEKANNAAVVVECYKKIAIFFNCFNFSFFNQLIFNFCFSFFFFFHLFVFSYFFFFFFFLQPSKT
jgi:hypothetical protein